MVLSQLEADLIGSEKLKLRKKFMDFLDFALKKIYVEGVKMA